MPGPLFWYGEPGLLARALMPLAWLNGRRTRRRMGRGPSARIGVPVIAVDVPDIGGGGRTQVAMALAMRLSERGVAVHVVVPGDGEVTRVAPETHGNDAARVLAAFAPTWVARDTADAARAAARAGAAAVVRLGGLAEPDLAHDLTLAVVDAARGFGNGRAVPAGPLRLPLRDIAAWADLLVSIGSDSAQASFAARWGDAVTVPFLRARLRPLPTGLPLSGLPVVAISGTRQPGLFFAALRDAGADLCASHALDPAAPLSETLMIRLLREAAQAGAQVVTSEMDAAGLPDALRARVMTIPLRLEIDDWAPLDAALDRLFPA